MHNFNTHYIYECRNRPSHPVVYTIRGTLIAACFSGKCIVCGTTHYHSSFETKSGKSFFHNISETTLYLQTTSQTVFEVELLRQLTVQLQFSACTFDSQASVYNALHCDGDRNHLGKFVTNFRRSNVSRNPDGHNWKLNVTRLEDGWFLYELIRTFSDLGLLQEQDFSKCTPGNRRDIEHLCQSAILNIQRSSPKWVQHACSIPGCKEGLVTIDGNEKLTRAMCAAPKDKVKCPVNHINLVQCCSKSPLKGGQHQKASKFCEIHQQLEDGENDGSRDDDESLTLTVSIPLQLHGIQMDGIADSTAALVGTLPDADSSELLTGCRKHTKVNKFFDRTAGVVAAVRPCGVVVNFTEMFTCESPTQMYIFLAFTFGHGRDIDRLKYVAYDRSCDLHPFLCNLQKKGAYVANFLLKNVKFMVDRFHVEGHTEQCCQPPSVANPTRGRYHPLHDDFVEIREANTECAEQSFKWLNKYKLIVRNMKQHRFNFFLYVMINLHNTFREEQLKHSGFM